MDGPPLLVLLPGLDGTGAGLHCFREEVRGLATRLVAYPADRLLGVEQLADRVELACSGDGPLILLGESFSGRVALEVAARQRSRVVAVVLVSSFAANPTNVPALVASFVPDFVGRIPPPRWLLRTFLVGNTAADALVDELSAAIASVAAPVLAGRLREVLSRPAPVAGSLAGLKVAYVRGTRDALVGVAGVETVRATGADVTVIDVAAPHLVLQREPAAAWRAISAFLASLSLHK